jgi:hypothetical protein
MNHWVGGELQFGLRVVPRHPARVDMVIV